jgi:hypothetical protein
MLFSDLCVDKFKCGNGKCIDMDLVCDKYHEDNCGDWSDEYCGFFLPSTAESKKGKNVVWIHDKEPSWPLSYMVVAFIATYATLML